MNRQDMMEDCPEEFEDRLEEIINHVEGRVTSIKETMDINSIGQIGSLDTANDMVIDLADDLY